MLFVEPRFFAFLAIVLFVYWALAKNGHRKTFLLLASYVFYGSWDWRFVIMLFALASGDYFFALRIGAASNPLARRLLVMASLLMNLGVLAYFKYCNFFIASALDLATALGAHLSRPTLDVILPVGISFFTFQSLSYTIDVYRRQLEPIRNMRDYLLVTAFFPQLVAGPITRPAYFLPQLVESRTVLSSDVKRYLLLFLIGFLKKACIADNIAPIVDGVFGAPGAYGNVATITGVWLYAAQIYCDFSGYSDMAIAVAGLMGYRLVQNFDAPYLCGSIRQFWRRWHMSLSSWIRDYIYVSLGGTTASRLLTYRNLMVTMLAAGLWHGAAWTFVAWGGLHGLALVVNREFAYWFPRRAQTGAIRGVVSWILTINFVCAAWIFFRSANFEIALAMLRRYLFLDAGGSESLPLLFTVLGPALLLLQYGARRYRWSERLAALGGPSFAFGYGGAWALAAALLPLGYRPFIYFQF